MLRRRLLDSEQLNYILKVMLGTYGKARKRIQLSFLPELRTIHQLMLSPRWENLQGRIFISTFCLLQITMV